jgi:hypothetical protein
MLSGLYDAAQSFDCPPQMTLLQAAYIAGLHLAHSSATLQRAAGCFADLHTLQVAFELGLRCTASVVNGIAASGCLHKLTPVCTQYHRQKLLDKRS